MTDQTLCLIGAGRAGGSLARQWFAKGGFKPVALYSRSGNAALAEEITATELQSLEQLPASDALLIASGDGAISTIAQQLSQNANTDWRGKLVFHLSGALPASCLQVLAEQGAIIASAHPVRAFSHERSAFDNTWVGLEGDPRAKPQLERAFNAIGGRCFAIDSAQKVKYHAAAVIASNHVVALADAAAELWQDAGLEPQTRTALFESLVSGVLDNLREQEPSQALTGPIARGDAATVAKHLQALDNDQQTIALLYRQLSQYLLKLTEQTHSSETQHALAQVLNPPK